MATVKQIRAALAASIRVLGGVQVSGYALSDPTPPSVEIIPQTINYDQALQRGHDQWFFTVRGFVAYGLDVPAQEQLDRWLAKDGADSMKAALESDRTLGGLIDDLNVIDCSGFTLFLREGFAPVLGAEWTVEIIH